MKPSSKEYFQNIAHRAHCQICPGLFPGLSHAIFEVLKVDVMRFHPHMSIIFLYTVYTVQQSMRVLFD